MRRDRLLVGVAFLGVCVLLVSLLFYSSLLLKVLGVAVTLGGLVPVVEKMWRALRPAEPRPSDALADPLAKAVHEQWQKTAIERVLMMPAPIPARWSLSDLAVAGSVAAAVGDPEVTPVFFPPLPGQTRVTEEQLRAGGGRSELFAVYAGISSGRVIVVGAPGAGKTGTAILLLLDALAHRNRVDDKDRARIPVPVLFTAHGWDPNTCSVQDWLAAQLATDYPLLQHRGGQAEAAALVADGAVALILDGLDEMDEARRPAALQALSDAPFRVVVLTRSQEMVQAVADGGGWRGAITLHLHDVTAPQAADYLQRARTGPTPAGWTQLLTHLQEHSDSVLTRTLSNPLTLTLIRDTYRPDDDVNDLLDTTRWNTTEELTQHLIAGILPAAYNPHPGRPSPRYSLTQAKQALAFLARQMNQDHTRDLAWWQIPRWAPTTPRILTSMLAGGLLGALLGALLGGLTFVLMFALGHPAGFGPGQGLSGRGIVLVGLVFGLGAGLPLGLGFGRGGRPHRVRNWRAIGVRSVLTGLAYGLVLVFATGLGFLLGLGLMFVLATVLGADLDAIPDEVRWNVIIFVGGLTVGFLLGLKRDLRGGLGKDEGSPQGPLESKRNNRVFRVLRFAFWSKRQLAVLGLKHDLLSGLSEDEGSPQGPLESKRNDQVFGLITGLAFALAYGLASGLIGLMGGLVSGLRSGLIGVLVLGLPIGLVYGITSSATWPTTLAWRQLQRSRHIPAVGLMPFLEEARDRGVLRTVGAVYQFRHATLQDQLAGQTTANPATSSAAQLP